MHKRQRFKSEKPSRFGDVGSAMKMKKTDLAIALSKPNEVKPSEKSYHGLVKRARQQEDEKKPSRAASGDRVEHSLSVCRFVIGRRTRRFGRYCFEENKDVQKAYKWTSLLRAAFGQDAMRDNNDVERAKFVIKNILETSTERCYKVMLHVKYATILVELNGELKPQHFQSALFEQCSSKVRIGGVRESSQSGASECQRWRRSGNGDGNVWMMKWKKKTERMKIEVEKYIHGNMNSRSSRQQSDSDSSGKQEQV